MMPAISGSSTFDSSSMRVPGHEEHPGISATLTAIKDSSLTDSRPDRMDLSAAAQARSLAEQHYSVAQICAELQLPAEIVASYLEATIAPHAAIESTPAVTQVMPNGVVDVYYPSMTHNAADQELSHQSGTTSAKTRGHANPEAHSDDAAEWQNECDGLPGFALTNSPVR